MDGVSLSHLLPGLVYDVPVSLGVWLISQQYAEEDVGDTIAIPVSPLPHKSIIPPGGAVVIPAPDPPDHQDDRPPRRRRKR